jgi:cytochrome c oxidase subunit III
MENIGTHAEHRDDYASKLGMWLFIFTELILFGGLFLVYTIFRKINAADFHDASTELNAFIGIFNTVLLLISSMTVAMSLTAMQKNNPRLAVGLIIITLILGLIFIFNKYNEWGAEIKDGLYPGSDFLATQKHGVILFFGLYFFMTGLHVFHMVVGIVLLSVIAIRIRKGKINSNHYVLLENGSLYWCLVDLIWIFLYPLLYLVT